MTDIAKISSVAYQKGSWMRYLLWGMAAVCIGFLVYFFINMMDGSVSATVPDGYKFAVTNDYGEGSRTRTTYYVYDDKILVEDEGFGEGMVNRAVMVYDGFYTSSLELVEDDTIEICEQGKCHQVPKVLVTIRNLLAGKIGREYIRL